MPRSLSPRRSVTQPPRRAPVRRAKAAPAPEQEASVPAATNVPPIHEVLFQEGIVAPHHKQALILAHAHARTTRPRPAKHHTWLYAVGIGFCGVLLAIGWWFTVGGWLKTQMQFVSISPLQEEFRRETQALETKYGVPKPEIFSGAEPSEAVNAETSDSR